jgi:hypothetical protein
MTSAAEYVQRDAVELPRIPDRTLRALRLDVRRSRSMARFAAHAQLERLNAQRRIDAQRTPLMGSEAA